MGFCYISVYVDAEMDANGIRFVGPDEKNYAIPWSMVRCTYAIPHPVFSIYDDHAQPLRIMGRVVRPMFRTDLTVETFAQARKLQEAYCVNPSNQFEIHLDPRKAKVEQKTFLGLALFTTWSFTIILFWILSEGFFNIPQNDPGTRFKNSMVIIAVLLIILPVLASWRILRSYWITSRSMQIKTVCQDGLTVIDKEGIAHKIQWETMSHACLYTTGSVVKDQSGLCFVLPTLKYLHPRLLIQYRIPDEPMVITRRRVIILCIVCVALGPLAAFWMNYLFPEGGLPLKALVFISILPMVMLLFPVFGIWILKVRAKRRESKSQ